MFKTPKASTLNFIKTPFIKLQNNFEYVLCHDFTDGLVSEVRLSEKTNKFSEVLEVMKNLQKLYFLKLEDPTNTEDFDQEEEFSKKFNDLVKIFTCDRYDPRGPVESKVDNIVCKDIMTEIEVKKIINNLKHVFDNNIEFINQFNLQSSPKSSYSSN